MVPMTRGAAHQQWPGTRTFFNPIGKPMMKFHHFPIALLIAAAGIAPLPTQAQKAATTSSTVASSPGKAKLTGRIVVSNDGKTRTVTTTATDAQGKKVTNVAVYDKQ